VTPPPAAPVPPAAPTRRLALPARGPGALSGSAFIERTRKLAAGQREQAIVREVLGGNVPAFLRGLQPVALETAGHRAVVWVTPDYLAIGSDEDFVRIPMTGPSAREVGRACAAILPTPLLVDSIYEQAAVKLTSTRYPPGPEMTSFAMYQAHHRDVEERRKAAGGRLGALTAGHKKDLVTSVRLAEHPGRLAIYGWFRRDGTPIQSLSVVHSEQYADYTHGVRLVDRRVTVDGAERDLLAVLEHAELAALISAEGSFSPRT
jgi:hypothetical protein